jgi:hypothetical protein
MKNRTRLLLAVSLFLLSATVNAQDKKPEKKESSGHPMNFIKVNLTSVVLKNYSFQYERILNKKFSFALGFRTMPNSTLPMQSTISKIIGDSPDAQDQIKNFKTSNTAITPEFRFYVGKKGYGTGFYLATFYRNVTYKGSGLEFTYENSLMVQSSIAMSGKLTGNTFGLMLGAQWPLGKHISLDWWILGPHYGSGKGEFNGIASQPLTVTEQNDLRQELEDFDIPLTKKTVSVNANGANVLLDGPFGGIRAGFLIGIRF